LRTEVGPVELAVPRDRAARSSRRSCPSTPAGWRASRGPAIIRLWRSSWEQFTLFPTFPSEIRKVIYTTDEIVNPLIQAVVRRCPDSCSSAFAGAA